MSAALLAAILAVSPCKPSARESVDDCLVRKEGIVADVTTVIERDGALPGASKEQTEVIMLAVAYKESSFALDVDAFIHRGKDGECGLWQTMPEAGKCPSSRLDAATLALSKIRKSFNACAANVPDERLAAYTGGACDRGLVASRERMRLARRLFASVVRAR